MRFSLDTYKERTDRIRWDDLDFASFSHAPLDPGALRCIRFMHDVEFHTICYLRSLLIGSAHSDPEVTSFLSFWAFEEYWHGEALAQVLIAHGELAGRPRVAQLRLRRQFKDKFEPFTMLLGSLALGSHFVAAHMAWGAVNEWTTQAGYSQLSKRADHPVLSELLGRIMRQEGRHIDFYASQAERRLAASAKSRRMTHWGLDRFWSPVGSDIMPVEETRHLATYLLGGDDGLEVAQRIDRKIDRLPGMEGLRLLQRARQRSLATTGSTA